MTDGRGLWLDHVTLSVPDMSEARAILSARFGLAVARSPARPDTHGRIMLHYSYIEMSRDEDPSGELALPMFFLGHADVQTAMDVLSGCGLAAGPATIYGGVDGEWLDGVLSTPDGVPAPVLVQRVAPPETAAGWPPPLESPHDSGVVRLSAVLLVTPFVAPAVEFYQQLCDALHPAEATPARAVRIPAGAFAPADRQWEIALPGGGHIIILDPQRPGPARDALLTKGSGVTGIELESAALADTSAFLGRAQVEYEHVTDERGPLLRIDPKATPGVMLSVRG